MTWKQTERAIAKRLNGRRLDATGTATVVVVTDQLAVEVKNRKELPAVTKDGAFRAEVVTNIGSVEDAELAIQFGAEGVGLFRTEFLYLQRSSMPTIAEQVRAFQRVFEVMSGRPVVVRTLDIGGDKEVSYLSTEKVPNPFLGWRAIRMIRERPDALENQFTALLQAVGQVSALPCRCCSVCGWMNSAWLLLPFQPSRTSSVNGV
ncbi:MAG: hypothetical protein KatS3mg046_789 [Bellilinea sp.]|nr:MAG: hypothetical protein KatS3mg046_789 [Bellilinea sp.]